MAEQTQNTPLYKQTRQEQKKYYIDISDILNQARTWQYQRNAKDDEILTQLTNGQLSFDKYKEYVETRTKRATGGQERSSVQAQMSKAVEIVREGYRNNLIEKWNERKVTYKSFKKAMENLMKKYDPSSDEAADIKQDIFDAQEAHRGEVMGNWRVKYETGAITAGEYQKELQKMQNKYAAKTEQWNTLMEERRRVNNWVQAENVRQKLESGKISIDRAQQLYLDLANTFAKGTQDRLDILGIVNNLSKQEYDKFVNKQNAIKGSQIADSKARMEILLSQYMTGEITKEEYQNQSQAEAALQSRLGAPLPEYEAEEWGAGKTGPQYKSERVTRYEGTLVGKQIYNPNDLSKYKPEDIVKVGQNIYEAPSKEMAGDTTTPGKTYKINDPGLLNLYKESEITRKGRDIYTNAGVDKRWGTYISNPDYLKYYNENELIRTGSNIYTKAGIGQKW